MNLSIKNSFLSICLVSVLIASCSKESVRPNENTCHHQSTQKLPSSFCGSDNTVELIADRTIRSGTVTINNDNDNYYITYRTSGNWYLNRLHMYAGVASAAPLDHDGHPVPGMFPYMGSNGLCKEFTFVVPANSIASCFDVFAYAQMVETDASGNPIRSAEAWAFGQSFTPDGHPATFMKYCKQSCDVIEGEGCSMSQGYWFASPVSVWPTSGVTVGGHTYSKAEALAIWNTTNAGGIKHSKKAFLQVATIKLSGSTISPSASIWDEVAICETWLASKGKLSPSYLPTGNNAVSAAAGHIGNWINNNHCE